MNMIRVQQQSLCLCFEGGGGELCQEMVKKRMQMLTGVSAFRCKRAGSKESPAHKRCNRKLKRKFGTAPLSDFEDPGWHFPDLSS